MAGAQLLYRDSMGLLLLLTCLSTWKPARAASHSHFGKASAAPFSLFSGTRAASVSLRASLAFHVPRQGLGSVEPCNPLTRTSVGDGSPYSRRGEVRSF
eukprot:3527514-Rhodomonas_salina.1